MKKYLIIATMCCAVGNLVAQQKEFINSTFMDKSVRPQDDLYNYVNGNWMKTVEIPSDRSRWGSFDELREHTDLVALGILKKSLNENFSAGSDGQKISDLYKSYVDFDTRDQRGIVPIEKQLQDIDKIKNVKQLYQYFINYATAGGNPFFGGYISAHMKNSNINALYLGGGSLGLGRSYYQVDDEKNRQTLEKYNQYINKLYKAIHPKENDSKGDKIIAFEKLIASKLKTIEESRDAQKRFNPVAVSDLNKLVKNMDIASYLKTMGFKADTVIIGELKYYQALDEILNQSNLSTIKEYLKFGVMNGATSYLTKELDELSFDFYGRQLKGQQEQRSLDKRGLEFVNGNVGELLGKLYVKESFPPAAKAACEELVQYLIKSFHQHIEDLTWMSAETKVRALDKLSKFKVKIGYPDEWKDYSKLAIGSSLYENVKNIRKWSFQENLAKQDKPVNKKEWGMSPQTVNAYFSPLNNEIVFPAAILQAPFYDYKADAAVNFGGIGAVIGHELSHGFDDSGAQYDGNGNLNDWWTAEDKDKFKQAGDALVAQFEAFEPVPGVFVNGRFTLGENIGDLGGTSVAFDALKMYLNDKGNPGLIDGHTQEQRFFLSWATIWRTKITDQAVINQIKTDPHSPGRYRAVGPVVNLDGFHEAFDTKEGDKMYVPKDKRIVIW